MPGHSRPKDGVLSHAYVPGIHVLFVARSQDVDARDKRGHDEEEGVRDCNNSAHPRESGGPEHTVDV